MLMRGYSRIGSSFCNTLIRYLSTNVGIDPHNSLITKVESSRSSGKSGVLWDTSFIAKDNITTKGTFTTSGSLMLSNYKSPFDATVVDLLEEAGLKLIGKANLDEFGMGSSNTNSYYGSTLNPLYENEERVPGGSSGGSAAAVAASLASFSLGTDTGGSVRLPASYCGVVGFKPSYGRISRWGVIAYAQSLDTVGILSKDVALAERVFNVLDKYDDKDPTSLPESIRTQVEKHQHLSSKSKFVIGIPQEFILEDLTAQARSQWLQVLVKLLKAGHELMPISIPSIKKLLSSYYTLATAEAASNLSRFDGARYGFNDKEVKETAYKTLTENRSKGFEPEVQRRILLGNYTLSSESGNHYLKANELRQRLVGEFNETFRFYNPLLSEYVSKSNGCDILISPTSIDPAPTIDEYKSKSKENFLTGYINDILTIPASLAGLPAISIPLPAAKQGIQLMAQYGDDKTLLQAAKSIEKLLI